MKREIFEITLNGELVDTRSKWNAARRSIEKLAGDVARSRSQMFVLAESSSVKEGFGHVSGVFVWRSVDHQLEFKIKKLN